MSTATAPDPSQTHGASTSADSRRAEATPKTAGAQGNGHDPFDPDSFRMTVGEHLEELRGRLILALGGLCVAVLACLLFSERIMTFLCQPLIHQLRAHKLPAELNFTDLTDPFMTYLKVTMIAAAAIAGPWMIFQAWQFVAAGLYPNERKVVTRYIPLSVTLFVSGLVFVYLVVLPLSIRFFLEFSVALTPNHYVPYTPVVDAPMPYQVPMISGDPKTARWGSEWIDTVNMELKIAWPSPDGDPNKFVARVISLLPQSMFVPRITIGEYIDLVITFMLTFGIAFQLPLVMLVLVTIGIVDVKFLKEKRRIIFFGMAVAAAFLAPGDIVTSMLALLIPLVVLYEFGLLLVKWSQHRKAREDAAAT